METADTESERIHSYLGTVSARRLDASLRTAWPARAASAAAAIFVRKMVSTTAPHARGLTETVLSLSIDDEFIRTDYPADQFSRVQVFSNHSKTMRFEKTYALFEYTTFTKSTLRVPR